jgi:signal recognition particle subunit SRP54
MNKSVMVVSADVYRPAAIDQLETLAKQVGANFWPSTPDQKPVDIAKGAVQAARSQVMDVLIIDTAGRLHIDDDMMAEIRQVHDAVDPVETLFVVDAMTGQDAVNTAKAFNDTLPLTGVVLTKADGDARGGAALSVKAVTGKPIKFLGVGEKSDALEPFHPDRMASRILGMGDVLTLVEEAERKLDKKKADKLATKLKKGRGFDLEDMLEQFQQLKKMGGIASMLEKLPGMGGLAKAAATAGNESVMKQTEAIILSMTFHERRFPDVINGSRKKRIAAGSGTEIHDVNRLLKQYKQMQKMMKKMSKKGGMKSMMRSMEGMMGGGGLPPGFGP